MNQNHSKDRFRSKLYFLDRNVIIAIKRYNELTIRKRDKIPKKWYENYLILKERGYKEEYVYTITIYNGREFR